ncbi:MAG: hypothetical protein IPF78_10350 [Flavobacteriales bacterium]|nr:hypothetical protein [Flavobacteriales bacterium]
MSSEVRQRTLDNMGNANRAGYELGGMATYAWGTNFSGRTGWMPRFSLAYQSVMGIRFTTDVYALSFFGNAGYEDLTAHLGPSAFEQVTYQTFGLGVEDRNSVSFVELAVVNGQALIAGQIAKADLYTAPFGRLLELQLNGEYHRSDTARNGFNKGSVRPSTCSGGTGSNSSGPRPCSLWALPTWDSSLGTTTLFPSRRIPPYAMRA